MSDERIRPVSGEIIVPDTGAADRRQGRCRCADVIDAEFETLRPDPAGASRCTLRLTGDRNGSRTVARSRYAAQGRCGCAASGRRAAARSSGSSGWGSRPAPSGCPADMRWSAESSLMPSAPQTQPANPLRISDVTSKIEEHGGTHGSFSSTARRSTKAAASSVLPPIEISVTANDGHVMRYNLGTSRDPLAAGGEFELFQPLRSA